MTAVAPAHTTANNTNMAPLQFKGEIMDFDLGIEIDHRKRYDEVFTHMESRSLINFLFFLPLLSPQPPQQDHSVLSELPHLQAQGMSSTKKLFTAQTNNIPSATASAPANDASSSASQACVFTKSTIRLPGTSPSHKT